MAEVKWIKIVTDIFDDDKILLIESMPEADAIIVIWFKLLCLAGKQNNSGVFLLNGRIAYTDEMFATIFRRPLNTVRLALKTFEQFGMIEIINDTITIPNWEKHQKLDALEASRESTKNRVAKYREKQKMLAESGNVTCNVTVTDGNADRIAQHSIDESSIDKSKADKSNDTKRKRFVKPTVEELNAYAKEIGFSLNADAFIDYYEANGWRIAGKSQMVDWKAAVRNWKRREKEKPGDVRTQPVNPALDYDQRQTDEHYYDHIYERFEQMMGENK